MNCPLGMEVDQKLPMDTYTFKSSHKSFTNGHFFGHTRQFWSWWMEFIVSAPAGKPGIAHTQLLLTPVPCPATSKVCGVCRVRSVVKERGKWKKRYWEMKGKGFGKDNILIHVLSIYLTLASLLSSFHVLSYLNFTMTLWGGCYCYLCLQMRKLKLVKSCLM